MKTIPMIIAILSTLAMGNSDDFRSKVEPRLDYSEKTIRISQEGVKGVPWGISEDSTISLLGKPNGYLRWNGHTAMIFGKSIILQFYRNRFSGLLLRPDFLGGRIGEQTYEYTRWDGKSWEIEGAMRSGEIIDSVMSRHRENWKDGSWAVGYREGHLVADFTLMGSGAHGPERLHGVAVINRSIDENYAADSARQASLPCQENEDEEDAKKPAAIRISSKGINGIKWGISEDALIKLLGLPTGYLRWGNRSGFLYGKGVVLEFEKDRLMGVLLEEDILPYEIAKEFDRSKTWKDASWELEGVTRKGEATDSAYARNPRNWDKKIGYSDAALMASPGVAYGDDGYFIRDIEVIHKESTNSK